MVGSNYDDICAKAWMVANEYGEPVLVFLEGVNTDPETGATWRGFGYATESEADYYYSGQDAVAVVNPD